MTSRFAPLMNSKQKEAYESVNWFVRLDENGSIDDQVRLAVIIAIDTAIENPGEIVYIRDPRRQHPICMHQVSTIANTLLWFYDMHIAPTTGEQPLSPNIRILQSRTEPVAGVCFVPADSEEFFTAEDQNWLSNVWSLSDVPTTISQDYEDPDSYDNSSDEPPLLSDDEECF